MNRAPAATVSTSLTQLIHAIPKAEVHVHLEGSLELADLLELAREAGSPLPGPAATLFDASTHDRPEDVSELSMFLRFLDWEGSLFRTREQLVRAAYRFAARQSAAGVVYSDVIVNPTHWAEWRTRVPAFLDALDTGFDEAERDGLSRVGVCVSLLRSQSRAEALELVGLLAERRPPRVVALSIDGDERTTGRTGERFAPAFDAARRAGLRRTVHAGESSGPEGVRDAIELLAAERVDHGVRAIEDGALVEALAERGIPLGVCLSSNLALGVSENLDEHPVRRLRDAGVRVTLNTDDPAPLGTSLENEWLIAATAFGWGPEEIADLARTSIEASFADDDAKRDARRAIDDLTAVVP